MIHFRPDNTDDYSTTDLAALNRAFQRVCEVRDLPSHSADIGTASLLDYIAENLLASYDAGLRGEALVTTGLG